MTAEKVIDLDAIRARTEKFAGEQLGTAATDRADLLALLDEARLHLAAILSAGTRWGDYAKWHSTGDELAADRMGELMDIRADARSWLARFPAPSPTDEETT